MVTAVQKRDIEILLDVYDKRVLTTHHITDIYFNSARCARRRLLHLHRAGFLDRFRPQPEVGAAPDHYVLGGAGEEIVAGYLGREIKEIHERNRMRRLAYSPFTEHLLAVNTFYSRLRWGLRKLPDHKLHWLGEYSSRQGWIGIVQPDGFGWIATSNSTLSMFLEMDMGTEPLSRLVSKLDAGYRLAAQGGKDRPDLLLFCFPSPVRETNARKVLYPIGMTIATTWLQFHSSDPLGDIWLPLGIDRRFRLLDLPVEPAANGSNGNGEHNGANS